MDRVKTVPSFFSGAGANRQVWRVIAQFVAWATLLYVVAYSGWFIETVATPVAALWANLLSVFLQGLGFASEQTGTLIRYDGFSMDIYYKCTGVYQAAGMAAAILAFPLTLRHRLRGLLACLAILSAINLVRLVSIFYVGVYFADFVDFFHAVFWEGMMIVLAIALFAGWAKTAGRSIPDQRRSVKIHFDKVKLKF